MEWNSKGWMPVLSAWWNYASIITRARIPALYCLSSMRITNVGSLPFWSASSDQCRMFLSLRRFRLSELTHLPQSIPESLDLTIFVQTDWQTDDDRQPCMVWEVKLDLNSLAQWQVLNFSYAWIVIWVSFMLLYILLCTSWYQVPIKGHKIGCSIWELI